MLSVLIRIASVKRFFRVLTTYDFMIKWEHFTKESSYIFVFLELFITKTYIYNVDPLKPRFYIVKLGFTEVYIIFFLISAQKHKILTALKHFETEFTDKSICIRYAQTTLTIMIEKHEETFSGRTTTHNT